MKEKQEENGIGRRDFIKAVVAGAATLSIAGAFPGVPKMLRPARANQPGDFLGCKLVVFGSDGLSYNSAVSLRNQGAPGLNSLNEPFLASSGGMSTTQPGWASIWTGLPSHLNNVQDNKEYAPMPAGYHIVKKLADAYEGRDFFPVWITGKGANLSGRRRMINEERVTGPHFCVRRLIEKEGHQGVCHGDEERENYEVYNLATNALNEAITHDNFLAFVHFKDPDFTGHEVLKNGVVYDYEAYMDAALKVDNYISYFMESLLTVTDIVIVYCSDHGFNFKSQGSARNGHNFAPYGMGATNVPTTKNSVDLMSLGRFIYTCAGGNPDYTSKREGAAPYNMYGVDMI